MAHSRGIPEPSEYGKFARRILRGYGRRIADADPEDLADMLRLSHEVDELIRSTIADGRARWGWTWEDIAKAADTTRSAAWQRWSRPTDQPLALTWKPPTPSKPTQLAADGVTPLLTEAVSHCGNPEPHEVHWPDLKPGEGAPPVTLAGTYVCPGSKPQRHRAPTGGWAAGFAREAAAYGATDGDE